MYQVASSSIQLFGHNRHGPKMGSAVPPFWGELGPHLTQCRLGELDTNLIQCGLGRGLPPYQVLS